jgi:AraC-like DNA-binding protein
MGAQELALVGLAGSGIGTVLGVPMAWPRGRRPADVRLLGVATILLSVIAGLISARIAGLLTAAAASEHTVNLLGMAALPLVIVYMRLATCTAPTFRGMAWLWAPAAAYVGYLGAGIVWRFDTEVPFAWMLPVVLGFTAASAVLLWRRPARPVRGMVAIVPPEWVVGFLAFVNVAQIVRMTFAHVEAVRPIVPLAMSAGFVALVAYVAWRSATLPVAAGAEVAPAGGAASGDLASDAAPRYEKSGLDEAAATALLARVDLALVTDRLFARADLTLADLARAAGSTPHLVSEALNRYAGVSFHERLMRVRVEDVKTQLVDPASDRYTIEGIGLSAGFGSRSALYAAFRKLEGRTPAAFRSQASGNRH